MGSKPKANVVNYDASIKSAQMKSRSLELLGQAQMEAYSSQKLAKYAGERAVQDINSGLSLLGDYLKDRNQVVQNQTPIYQSFLSNSTQTTGDYAEKASGVLSNISGGYTSG